MRAGEISEPLTLPHEPEAWMTFRSLSGRELDEAEEALTRRTMEMVKGMDLAALRTTADAQKAEKTDSFDKDTLVRYGVFGCSECNPCTEESKTTLNAPTRNWAVSVILDANVRPAGESNGSGGKSDLGNSPPNSSEPHVSPE